ncbi:MAG: biotin/lipoyl-binding protein [Planctomycetes bacterium]|nr:biotin/lipoyl-binding protein [Planctomycetota bacterium]
MNWSRRIRPVVIVLGVLLLVGTLIGAGALTAGHGNPTDGPKSANPAQNPSTKAGGPITMGTVDSDPPPVSYGLPTVLQSGSIAEVFVKDGQEVKADEKLYTFDTSIQTSDLKRASAAVAVAKTKVDEAKEGARQHAEKVKVLNTGVDVVAEKVKWQTYLVTLIEGNLNKGYMAEKIPEADWKAKRDLNADLYKANIDKITAINELSLKRAELDALKAADPQVLVKEAEAGVDQAKAEVNKAETAIRLCTVTAKTAGTVEQVKISPGATLGISTRDPALWLIPAGPRVVRAEIEADFAHRVSNDLIGKEVTIYDNADPKITYKGTVRRIGGTFLPKRSESLIMSDTRVLEALVEVTDPAPAGKPPLRVGQRVRVNLGQ